MIQPGRELILLNLPSDHPGFFLECSLTSQPQVGKGDGEHHRIMMLMMVRRRTAFMGKQIDQKEFHLCSTTRGSPLKSWRHSFEDDHQAEPSVIRPQTGLTANSLCPTKRVNKSPRFEKLHGLRLCWLGVRSSL